MINTGFSLVPSRAELGHVRKPSPFSYPERGTTTFRGFFCLLFRSRKDLSLLNIRELQASEQQNNSDFLRCCFPPQ